MGDVKVTSNAKAVKRELMSKAKRAMRIIGMKAESYAKDLAPVDTGLLRNSITFAIGGQPTGIQTYRSNTTDKNGKKIEVKEGLYQSTAPNDEDGKVTLYVGTNVQYAPYQELGHHTVSDGWVAPQQFLRPAMENHVEEYKRIIKNELK